jgi:hypothetical protein
MDAMQLLQQLLSGAGGQARPYDYDYVTGSLPRGPDPYGPFGLKPEFGGKRDDSISRFIQQRMAPPEGGHPYFGQRSAPPPGYGVLGPLPPGGPTRMPDWLAYLLARGQ